MLEIGAGRGRLTEQLARVAGRVLAIEVDPALARSLDGRWGNVEIVVADATSVELPNDPFRVVSNLPFHRTTDLLHLLLDDPEGSLVRADLVVEWEVAVKRALPWPSSVNGVVWSAFWEPSLARRLPRSAFAPVRPSPPACSSSAAEGYRWSSHVRRSRTGASSPPAFARVFATSQAAVAAAGSEGARHAISTRTNGRRSSPTGAEGVSRSSPRDADPGSV